ncbi:hypothetical protein K435DRAFT_794622 [Dendrothele bispora CBS 962.96]|uniref:Uncharacterized protein n=1 Tax=Dendrothele bispora (strain CBS 962.96) TaxID=1314807 RepID=A0A4S8MCT8_DENBC|nr:hypothetical protein K435DRAFT_794622 [Dendrothele bispora CBS 962.96]
MVNFTNLTTAAAAASLSIVDHTQSFALDLVNGNCQSFNPVQQFGRLQTIDQQITSAKCGTTLSYAGSTTGVLGIRSQPVSLVQSDMTWTVTPADPNNPIGAFRFIENVSGLGFALTAWANDPSIEAQTAPLTLEPNRPNDPRQSFFITTPVLKCF